MIEPYWNEIEQRMMKLTLKQLRPVLKWFNGSLCGASSKRARVHIAVSQMQYWWNHVEGGQGRVSNVLKELESVEFFS